MDHVVRDDGHGWERRQRMREARQGRDAMRRGERPGRAGAGRLVCLVHRWSVREVLVV